MKKLALRKEAQGLIDVEKVFDKSTLFMQNKANFKMGNLAQTLL